jgi:hypothetical protein
MKVAEAFETGLRMGPSKMLVGGPVSNAGAVYRLGPILVGSPFDLPCV